MKKNILLIAAIVFMASSAMAQDIYLGASIYSDDGIYSYKILKNGNVIHSQSASTDSYYMNDMVVGDNGDLYYLNHLMPEGNQLAAKLAQWTDVRKISCNDNTVVYDCPVNQGINLNALAYDNGDIYACGSYFTEEGNEYALITKNGTILYQNEEDGYSCFMNDIIVYNGDVFTCGEKAYNYAIGMGDGYRYAAVWKNGVEIANFNTSEENYNIAYDLAIYDGYIYVTGRVAVSSNKGDKTIEHSTLVWRADPTSTNQTLEPFISIDNVPCRKVITVDAGSIYYSYDEYGGNSGLRKYNLQTVTDELDCTIGCFERGNIVATNHGIYSANNSFNSYYLDGNRTNVNISDANVNRIAVYYPQEYNVYDLPFEDDFETGVTHYDDWFMYEYDHGNGYYASYWERFEYEDGEIAASHRNGCEASQQADLVTPPIRIPANYSAKLGFFSNVWDVSQIGGGSVWIMENPGVPLSSLTTDEYEAISQRKIWDFEDESEFEEDYWEWIEVDIPEEYAGKTINLVFFYIGSCAHRWLVDDIEVTGEEITEVKEIAEDVELSVMPNPASDFISITGVDGIEDITIYNTLGQVVKTAQVSDGETISIEGLSQGVYMLKSEKSAQTIKFIVE